MNFTEGIFTGVNSKHIINDGRWVPAPTIEFATDLLTLGHGSKGHLRFTDGHVQPVPLSFGADTDNALPGL